MNSATVHHLPSATKAAVTRGLDEQVKDLQPGQWVRVTWVDERDSSRGVVEGPVRRPSLLANTLYVGNDFCLRTHMGVNIGVTAVETHQRPRFDIEDLAPLMEAWAAASVELEQKPIGRTKTGDNTAEQNALFDCETAVRDYLKSVTIS